MTKLQEVNNRCKFMLKDKFFSKQQRQQWMVGTYVDALVKNIL